MHTPAEKTRIDGESERNEKDGRDKSVLSDRLTALRKKGRQAMKCAFVAARSVAGNHKMAESAVLEAIDRWNPETETAEALLRLAIVAAVRGMRREFVGWPQQPAGEC